VFGASKEWPFVCINILYSACRIVVQGRGDETNNKEESRGGGPKKERKEE